MNLKRFLLFAGIISLPLRITYRLVELPHHNIGWTNGIFIRLSDIPFGLLFLYLIINQIKFNKTSSKILAPIGFFIGACLLSTINSTWDKATLYQAITIAQVAFLYYFVLTNSIESKEDMKTVIMAITMSLLFQGVIANLQFATGQTFDFFSTGKALPSKELIEDTPRVFGTVGNPNGFAAFLAPLIILNISMLLATDQLRKVRFIAVIFGLSALLFSFSRGGWVSFVCALLLFSSVKNRTFKEKSILFPLLMVGAIFAIFFYDLLQLRIFGDDGNAAMSRLPVMKLTLNIIKEHPFIGIGTNTFRYVVRSYVLKYDFVGIYIHEVHNLYLLIFAEAGLVGIFTFLWLMISILREGLHSMRKAKNKYIYFLSLGILFSFVTSSIHMMVDIFNSRLLWSNLFVLASLLTANSRIFIESPQDTSYLHKHQGVKSNFNEGC